VRALLGWLHWATGAVLIVFVFTPLITCLSVTLYVTQLAFNWLVSDEQD
jgi:hypothetical protein